MVPTGNSAIAIFLIHITVHCLGRPCTCKLWSELPQDCIEYDVTIQIPALQHGVCELVRVRMHACAREIKLGMLRAYLIETCIRPALQDGDFHSNKKGLIDTV